MQRRGVTVTNIIFFLSHVRPPPTRLSQLIEVQLIVQEREGKERECVLSLLQELAPREKKWTNHFINETERLWAQDTLNNVL